MHGVGCLRTSRAPRWRFTRMADERTWASFKGKQSSVESQAGLPLDSNGMQWAGSSSKGQRPKECPMPCHLMLKWHQGRLASKVLSTQFLELNWEVFLFSKPLTKDQRSSLQVYHLRTYQSQNRQRAAGPPRKDRGRPSKCKASASRMATCADSQSRDAGSSQKKGL